MKNNAVLFVVMFFVVLVAGFGSGFLYGRQQAEPAGPVAEQAARLVSLLDNRVVREVTVTGVGQVARVNAAQRQLVVTADGSELTLSVDEAATLFGPREAFPGGEGAEDGTTAPDVVTISFSDIAVGDTVSFAAIADSGDASSVRAVNVVQHR